MLRAGWVTRRGGGLQPRVPAAPRIAWPQLEGTPALSGYCTLSATVPAALSELFQAPTPSSLSLIPCLATSSSSLCSCPTKPLKEASQSPRVGSPHAHPPLLLPSYPFRAVISPLRALCLCLVFLSPEDKAQASFIFEFAAPWD